MSATALFTASADPFFATTKAIRAELKDLQKLATQINIGAKGGAPRTGGGSGGGQSPASQSRDAAAASRAQAAATRAATLEIQKQIAEAKLQLAELKKLEAQSRQSANAQRSASTQATRELRAQKQEASAWSREIDAGMKRNSGELNRFGVNVRQVNTALRDLPRDIRVRLRVNGGDEISRIQADMRRASRLELKERAGTAFSSASTMGGVAILGSLGAATKVAADFDGAMRNVNSIAQLSDVQLKKLSSSVLSISADPRIQQGPRDLAAALYDIQSSGFNGAKGLDILKISAIGASAGLTNTGTSGKALMATLNSGIPGVNGAKQAMDVLFKTVDIGVLNFEQLAGSIGTVLPTAAKAKIPLQELGGAIAIMTKSGQSASEATNDLLNLIVKIANPGRESIKYFKTLGISYGYAALQAKGLPGVLAEIEAKTGGNADAIKKLLPDMQAQRGALSLLKNAGRDYADAVTQMGTASNGAGAAMRALNQQNKGASAGIKRFQKELEILSILAGTTLVPALNSLLRTLSGVFRWFSSLSPEMQSNVVKWTAFGGVLLLVGGQIQGLITTLALVRAALGLSSAAAAAAAAATTGAGTAATVSAGGFTAFRAALAGLTLQGAFAGIVAALPIILAVAAAAGVAYLAYDAWRGHTDKLAQAQRELNSIAGKTNHVMDQAFEYSKGDPAILKTMTVLRQQIKDAGGDSHKLDAALKQLTEVKHQIELSTKLGNSAKALLIDDLGMTQDFVVRKEAVLKVKMDEASKSWWQSFMERLDQAVGVKPGSDSGFAGYSKGVGQGLGVIKDAYNWVSNATDYTTDADAAAAAGRQQKAQQAIEDKRAREWAKTQKFLGLPQAKSFDFGLKTKLWQPPSFSPSLPKSVLDSITGPSLSHAQLLANARREAAARAKTSTAAGGTGVDNSAVSGLLAEAENAKAQKKADAAKRKAEAAQRKAEAAERKHQAELARIHNALVKEQKDQLNDLATAYEAHARRVEAVANKEIQEWTKTRDALRNVFGQIQDQFVQLGIIDDPMGPSLRSFEKLLGLEGRVKSFGQNAANAIRGLSGRANAARSQVETLSGEDGTVPTRNGGSFSSAANLSSSDEMPSYMKRMFARVGERTAVQCGQAISNALGRPGFATAVARGTAGRSVRAINGRFPEGTVVSQDYGRKAQHFFVTYTGADGVQRKLESTTAGGQGRHYRSDRPLTARDLARVTRAALPSGVPFSYTNPGSSTRYSASLGNSPRHTSAETSRGVSRGVGDPAASLVDTLTNFDGALVKVAAVDKAWGRAVRNIDGNSVRFAVQTQLSSEEFQTQIQKIANATHRTVPQVIKWFRQLANNADFRINRIKAIDAVRDSVSDLQKQIRAVRSDGNPLGSLKEEMRSDGKYGAAPERDKERLRQETLRLSLEQANKATRDMTRSESDRNRVLNLAAPALNAATIGTDAYERALERANRTVEAWRAPDVQGLLKAADDYDRAGGQMLQMAARIKASGLDLFGMLSGNASSRGNASKAQAASLRKQADQIVQSRTGAQNGAADYGRKVDRTQENLATNFELDNRVKLLQTERSILLDNNRSEAQKTAQIERENFILDEQVKLMKAGHNETRAHQLAVQRADKTDVAKSLGLGNDALRQFNASSLEAERSLAAFGDTTGLAALKFDLAKGALVSLSAEQKAQTMVDQAAIQGLQQYGQQFDALYSQQFALQADFSQRQAALHTTLSEQQKQELGWKAQDIEQSARLSGLTDAQRAAYDRQRPVVEALRQQVRALLADSEKLAAQEWFKGYADRAQTATLAPDKNARRLLEQQLRESGVTDPITIKAILDASELETSFQDTQSHIQDFIGQVNGIFSQGLDELYTNGWSGFFNSISKGFSDLLNNISKQVLSAALTKAIMGAFPQLAQIYDGTQSKIGDMTQATLASAAAATQAAVAYAAAARAAAAFAAAGGSASGPASPTGGTGATGLLGLFGGLLGGGTGPGKGKTSSGGLLGAASSALGNGGLFSSSGLGSGFSLNSHAIGLDRVPYNGYTAMLHQDEAILNASDAHTWRGMQTALTAPQSSTRNVGGDTHNWNNATIVLPNVTKPEEFAPALQGVANERASRRSMRQAAYDELSGGAHGR